MTLNDRQIEKLWLKDDLSFSKFHEPKDTSPCYTCHHCRHKEIYGNYRASFNYIDDACKFAVSNKMLRAFLEDYLERLGEWKYQTQNHYILNAGPPISKIVSDYLENEYERLNERKSWLKSRKVILEEGLNKTWPEMWQILEENK